MMAPAIQNAVTAFLTGGGCSIILYVLQRHDMKKDETTHKIDKIADAVRGIEHTEIIDKGEHYIDRGYITPSEFSEIDVNLYRPYKALGGNGSAEKMMDKLKELPTKEGENHD